MNNSLRFFPLPYSRRAVGAGHSRAHRLGNALRRLPGVFPASGPVADCRAKASPAEAAQLQSWHQTHIGLTAQEAAQLKQVAATHVAAMDALEKQAGQIVQAFRAQFPAKLASPASLPPPPPQLAQFQQQRDELTLSHIQSLQASLSASSFTKLDSWIQANFNQRTGTPSSVSHLPPQPGGNQ